MFTIQIGWSIPTRPAVEHGSRQKSSFSTRWTWPLTIVTPFYLHAVGRKSHRDFRLTLIREVLARAGNETGPSMTMGKQPQTSTNIIRHDTRQNKHWPVRNPTQRRCPVCSAKVVTRSVKFKCLKCDVALWVDNCFIDYHTIRTIGGVAYDPPKVWHDPWSSSVQNVTWQFVWTKIILSITT